MCSSSACANALTTRFTTILPASQNWFTETWTGRSGARTSALASNPAADSPPSAGSPVKSSRSSIVEVVKPVYMGLLSRRGKGFRCESMRMLTGLQETHTHRLESSLPNKFFHSALYDEKRRAAHLTPDHSRGCDATLLK